jgi:guanylate cyclase soluble subunit beta
MYGIINDAIKTLVVSKFGAEAWATIVANADVDPSFELSRNYSDSVTLALVGAAAELLGISAAAVLETFGEYFAAEYLGEKHHLRLLTVLGPNLAEFLKNLDNLHGHLQHAYPDAQFPSFFAEVADRRDFESDDDVDHEVLLLHYHSDRKGLWPIVIGLVKGVARVLFKVNVAIERVPGKTRASSETGDHVVFSIKYEMSEGETSGAEGAGRERIMTRRRSPGEKAVLEQFGLTSRSLLKPWPWHVLITEDLEVAAVGPSLKRWDPSLKHLSRGSVPFGSVAKVVRPKLPKGFDFDFLMSRCSVPFVLKLVARGAGGIESGTQSLKLEGQLQVVQEPGKTMGLLFLAHPQVTSLDQMLKAGLFISDLPLHGSQRRLVLMNEQREVERKLACVLRTSLVAARAEVPDCPHRAP